MAKALVVPPPKWWHPNGIKMEVRSSNLKRRSFVLASSGAILKFTRIPPKEKGGEAKWFVEWKICMSTLEEVTGTAIFTKEDMTAAFGLEPSVQTPGHSRHLLDHYVADCANQGRFIRKGDCLNIPCPGTGHNGDPNISVRIDDEMRGTVRLMLVPLA